MGLEREACLADERSIAEEQERQRQARRRERELRDEQRRKVQEWREERAEEAKRQKQAAAEERHLRASQREACQTYRRLREQQRQPPAGARTPTKRCFSQEDRQRIAHRNLDMLRRKLQAQTAPAVEGYPPQSRDRAYDVVESRLYNTTESFVQKKTTKAPESPPQVPGMPPLVPRMRPSSANARGSQPPAAVR